MLDIEFSHVIIQILGFLLMLWILKRFAWKPLSKVLEERSDKIKQEFAEIDAKHKEADRLAQVYADKIHDINEEARVIIQNGVNQAKIISQEIHSHAQKDAKEIIQHAQEEAAREVEQAKIQLKNEIVNIATTAVEKIVKQKLTDKGDEKLIEELIKEVSINDQ